MSNDEKNNNDNQILEGKTYAVMALMPFIVKISEYILVDFGPLIDPDVHPYYDGFLLLGILVANLVAFFCPIIIMTNAVHSRDAIDLKYEEFIMKSKGRIIVGAVGLISFFVLSSYNLALSL